MRWLGLEWFCRLAFKPHGAAHTCHWVDDDPMVFVCVVFGLVIKVTRLIVGSLEKENKKKKLLLVSRFRSRCICWQLHLAKGRVCAVSP